MDTFKNCENMASELRVGRQNGIQTAQRRDPRTPNGDQNPLLVPPDLAPGSAKMTTESHSGVHYNFSFMFGTLSLDLRSPVGARMRFWEPLGIDFRRYSPLLFRIPESVFVAFRASFLVGISCTSLLFHRVFVSFHNAAWDFLNAS